MATNNYVSLAVILGLLFAGCGNGDDPGQSGNGGDAGNGAATGGADTASGGNSSQGEPRGACAEAERIGQFSAEKQERFGVVQGTVLAAVVPTSVRELVKEVGDCRMLRRRTLTCSPACVGLQTCSDSGECIEYPSQISVGTVTITGLTKAAVMEPVQPGNSYFAQGMDNPPYTADASVVLSASGSDALSAFEAYGRGSVPLEEPSTWILQEGSDFELTWTAAAEPAPTEISLELNVDQHGLSPVTLACEFPDSGVATVPAELVDDLINSGVSGYPSARLMRRTVDHVDTALGCVEFVVGSPVLPSLRVAGYEPCDTPADCSGGMTCNTVIQLCE